jgi:hypothetical protein
MTAFAGDQIPSAAPALSAQPDPARSALEAVTLTVLSSAMENAAAAQQQAFILRSAAVSEAVEHLLQLGNKAGAAEASGSGGPADAAPADPAAGSTPQESAETPAIAEDPAVAPSTGGTSFPEEIVETLAAFSTSLALLDATNVLSLANTLSLVARAMAFGAIYSDPLRTDLERTFEIFDHMGEHYFDNAIFNAEMLLDSLDRPSTAAAASPAGSG